MGLLLQKSVRNWFLGFFTCGLCAGLIVGYVVLRLVDHQWWVSQPGWSLSLLAVSVSSVLSGVAKVVANYTARGLIREDIF